MPNYIVAMLFQQIHYCLLLFLYPVRTRLVRLLDMFKRYSVKMKATEGDFFHFQFVAVF